MLCYANRGKVDSVVRGCRCNDFLANSVFGVCGMVRVAIGHRYGRHQRALYARRITGESRSPTDQLFENDSFRFKMAQLFVRGQRVRIKITNNSSQTWIYTPLWPFDAKSAKCSTWKLFLSGLSAVNSGNLYQVSAIISSTFVRIALFTKIAQ